MHESLPCPYCARAMLCTMQVFFSAYPKSFVRRCTSETILTSADAGESLKIMDFYDEMQGGKLEIIGNYNDDLIGQPLTGKLLVSNYHITDAPILARVLSVMSLTGVLDELEGGGLEFRNLEIPFI